MSMLAWQSSLQISHEHYRHRRRNGGGRLPDCHRVSVHFMTIFVWVKATVKVTRS